MALSRNQLTREDRAKAEDTRINQLRQREDQARANQQTEITLARQKFDLAQREVDLRRQADDYSRDVADFRYDTEQRIVQMREAADRAELDVVAG